MIYTSFLKFVSCSIHIYISHYLQCNEAGLWERIASELYKTVQNLFQNTFNTFRRKFPLALQNRKPVFKFTLRNTTVRALAVMFVDYSTLSWRQMSIRSSLGNFKSERVVWRILLAGVSKDLPSNGTLLPSELSMGYQALSCYIIFYLI